MASDATFEQLWKGLLVYAPECPVPLAQQFVNGAYSRALSRQTWTHLRNTGVIQIPEVYDTGTVTVTQNSTTVTGALTVWTSAMIGRQFYIGEQAPFYTITAVNSTTELVLDQAYGGESDSGLDYDISLVYAVMPSDFSTFESVYDVSNKWKLWTNFTQDRLNQWDAGRTSSGTTWVLALATPSPVTSTTGQTRFEMWPRTLPGPYQLYYTYNKKPALLSGSQSVVAPLRGDVIREGALAELALWPGTSTSPNPYHSIALHREHMGLFEKYMGECIKEDNENGMMSIRYDTGYTWPYAPIDANFWQTHDFWVA